VVRTVDEMGDVGQRVGVEQQRVGDRAGGDGSGRRGVPGKRRP
jgi:hypothetical protein